LLEAVVDGFPADGGDERLVYDGASGERVDGGMVFDFDIGGRWVETSCASQVREIHLRFLTPFRYKHEGRLGQPLTFEILMRNLLRRFDLLSVHSPISLGDDRRDLPALSSHG
jgi:hypothetical protein